MSLTFYRAPHSTASITELVFEELGVPHEVVTLDLQKGDTKKPEFTKLNPNAKVPVVVHDGTVLWESAAITMYLGETFGVEKKLWPAAGPKRGEAMKWVTWGNVTFGEAIGRWLRNTSDWFPAEQHNAKAAEVGKKDMEDCLAILDSNLGSRSFLLGNDFSLVDAHLSGFLDWLRAMKVDVARWKNVEAWGKRCSSRPACERMTQRENANAKK
jgi:glutathione S-transferase